MGIMNMMREAKRSAKLQFQRKVNQIKVDRFEEKELNKDIKIIEKQEYRKEKLKMARQTGKSKAKSGSKFFKGIDHGAGVFLTKTEDNSKKHKTKDVWGKQGRNVFQ